MRKRHFMLSALLVFISAAQAQYNYPATKTVDSSDTYFGVTFKDPYRWLENLKDSNVINWFRVQTEFTDNIMQGIGGIDSLLGQLQHYTSAKTWRRSPLHKSSCCYYYNKWERGQLSQNLYYKKVTDTTEHLLFDSWSITPGMRYSLADLVFSPNEQYFLAAFDKNGEEYPFIKVYDLKNRRWLKDSIPHGFANTIKWTADSRGFIYTYNTGDLNAPNATENEVIKYHILNTPNFTDYTVMSNRIRNSVEKKISNSYYAAVYTMNSLKRIYCQPNQGFEFEFSNVFYIDNSEFLSSKKQWKQLYAKSDSVYEVRETSSGYYFICAKGNGFNSLRYSPSSNPDFAHARIIFPEDSIWQLESLGETRSYVLANYSKYGFINKTVFIDKKSGKEVKVSAIMGYDRYSIVPIGLNTDECVFVKQYPNKPIWTYSLDIAGDKLSDNEYWAPHGQTLIEGSDDIVTELLEVPSFDGTLVPMSIMRSKYTKMDGTNSCILYGYGAYGISTRDNTYNLYDPISNLLVQRGVILAHAYVRGGGEKGEAWHKAGMKENKPNGWKDFIACAEYLVERNYTQPAHLACTGASAGGVLIGRAITERPDLFAAASIQAGALNLIRGKVWANQINNYPEYGNPEIEREMKGLIEMDAVIHVKPGVKYPAVYINTGINDSRVAPWMPGKMAASLQANSSSGKPVLLHTDFEGGHFGDANAGSFMERLKTSLKEVFFLLWQTGHKEFQKKY